MFKIHRTKLFALLMILLVDIVPRSRATGTEISVDCDPAEKNVLFLSATNKSGQAIPLRKEDLILMVGKKPAVITELVSRTDQPTDVAILIDTSVSQEEVLPSIKLAAKALVERLARVDRDRLALVSFSTEPTYYQRFTKETQHVSTMIEQLKIETPPGYVGGGVVIGRSPIPSSVGSTSLWDATRKMIVELFSTEAQDSRRAVVLFTDGQDTSSKGKLKSAIDESLKHDVEVYVIGTAGSQLQVLREPLKKLAEETGGVARFPKKKRDYDLALTEIYTRLSAQYRIAYCSVDKERGSVRLDVVSEEAKKLEPVLAYRP
jgi:Ca-activated chloride channel family protein